MDFRLSLPKDSPPDDDGELELEPLPPDEEAQRNPGRQVNKWGDEVEPPPAQEHPIAELYKDVNDIWREHAEQEQDAPLRFSLRQMLWATAAAGVMLSLSRLLPPSIAAAVMGVLVLGTLFLSSQITYSTTAQLIWWVMLFVYLLLTIIAIVQV